MKEDEQLGANGLKERAAAPKEIVAEKWENFTKPEEINWKLKKGGGASSHEAVNLTTVGKKWLGNDKKFIFA